MILAPAHWLKANRVRICLAATITLMASACFPFSAGDEVLVGPYRLWGIDTDEDMAICWSSTENECIGDGLPGPTVFAAGFDEKYLVAAVHPKRPGEALNRRTTTYYYVIRTPGDTKFPYGGIKGPFDLQEFQAEKSRLHLPEFSRTFENLK